MDVRAYIEERSIPEPMSGCWIWLHSLGSHGYGNARIPVVGNTVSHRASYAAFIGPIPAGMLVQHSCDNKWCVAPHHLALGTDATNAADKQRKGRAAKKLTARDVREIAAKVRAGRTQASVAREYAVDAALIGGIAAGRIWRDVLGTAPTAGLCTLCDAPTVGSFATCERCRSTAEARKKLRRRAERAARAAAGPPVDSHATKIST